MNNFERKVMDEYVKCHAVPLLQKAEHIAQQYSDVTDPKLLREHELSISSRNRFVYLALKEYHNSLAHILAEHDILLPDFDTLVSGEEPHQN